MRTKRKQSGVEWVGGLISLPAYITGDGEPYRPEMLVWMSDQGAVLGSTLGKPGEVLAQACESLQGAMAHPMIGLPHSPQHIRVDSPELRDALRAGYPALDVLCAPTPEIDDLVAAMREQLDKGTGTKQSYLSADVGPDAVAAFFRAAAALFRAKPWTVVPSDQCLVSVTIEALEVSGAAMSIIGQMGEHFGLVLFADFEDFDAYLDAAVAMEHGEEAPMPPHFSFNFDRRGDLGASLVQEIEQHRWELASAEAYPWLVAVDGDLVVRPATAREVTIAEALALALPGFLAEKQALLAAWNGGEPVSRTISVPTQAGQIAVTLGAPYEQDQTPYEVPGEGALLGGFASSPEGKALDEIGWCEMVADLAAEYFDASITALGPAELREIVFELIPRKVSIEAAAASEIIEELRAFYTFLEREDAIEQADACLRVLGGDAVKRLEAALSDTSSFGLAKSLLMAGRDAGFDIETKEGVEAWMRNVEERGLPASVRLPSPPARARKKQQRKAARKARKRNR